MPWHLPAPAVVLVRPPLLTSGSTLVEGLCSFRGHPGPGGASRRWVTGSFQQVYRSGIKVAYVDFNQVGLCYPSPADDPDNHRVKAQNLGVVWPTYRQQARGASSPLAEFLPAKSS